MKESEILIMLINAGPKMQTYRSRPAVNEDNDMARISFDLPIIQAIKLMSQLKDERKTNNI